MSCYVHDGSDDKVMSKIMPCFSHPATEACSPSSCDSDWVVTGRPNQGCVGNIENGGKLLVAEVILLR